jgi:glycogen(starch) synthase
MHILMLAWEYPPHLIGGMGRHITELSPALAARGVTVEVLTPLLRGGALLETMPNGIVVRRVPMPNLDGQEYTAFVQQANTAMKQAALAAIGDAEHYDLIHAHDWLVAETATALKHAWRRPLIATIHATERGRQQGHITSAHSARINHLEWLLTYEAWRVIACSRFMSGQVQEYFQVPADKIDVVPNGVAVLPLPFSGEQERVDFRRRYAADDTPMALYMGRVVYEKGVHVLVEAWARVAAQRPGSRLVMAGTGDQLEAVKQRAEALGIQGSITFTGFISDEDRDRLYRVADVATFPSIYEPFGIVALEAMAAGCPVIVSEAGGLGEVVSQGETGLKVPAHSPDALAGAILETFANPEQAQTRARAALEVVNTIYPWPTIAKTTAEVYDRALAQAREVNWAEGVVDLP